LKGKIAGTAGFAESKFFFHSGCFFMSFGRTWIFNRTGNGGDSHRELEVQSMQKKLELTIGNILFFKENSF
jgi:hypothetical protein